MPPRLNPSPRPFPSSPPFSFARARARPPPSTLAVQAPQPQRFRLVRQRHLEELEARKERAHQDAITAFEAKLAEYNKELQRPCYFALQM